ncbi:MAG: DUF1622 domain-containing protein [Desulforhopalus sp.]
MIEFVKPIAEFCAAFMEIVGIFIIISLTLFSLIKSLIQLLRKNKTETIFLKLRHRIGRGILLGLEFLVAADIIHTVAVELTFETVGVLSIIVLIRTFLSFTLDVELTGKWPWQKQE